jgi:hypothetical protein
VVGAGAGAATTARRWCWRGYPFLVRGARDVHAKASAGVRVHGGVIDTGLAWHGAAGIVPRLDGRGVHKRGETGVLTSVATGRSGARR